MARGKRIAKPPSAGSRLLRELLASPEALNSPPGDLQMRVDIHVCLLDAMSDRFGIAREDITNDIVPSDDPIGALSTGWGICLALYASYLRELRPIYSGYIHKERYTEDTLNKSVGEIKEYLREALLEQLGEVFG